ncbi:MAG: UDP-2,3-diacylglucosamine diphosphatase [Gammaproteobacteria bacterium]
MALPVLLISDLHLDPARQDITGTLFAFLEQWQGCCAALYILGDLFEVWIGDDAPSILADEVAQSLRKFSESGPELFLMHGNRDFLLGDAFATRCGATLVHEPYELRVGQASYLLLHGDVLCTDDVDYQDFRRQVRNPAWQQGFLAKSVEEREAFARSAREQSARATASKHMEIMDVNQQAVEELIRQSGQTHIIHGHTHRPAQHSIQLRQPVDGQDHATRTVLGDWDSQAWYVAIDENELVLQHLPLRQG